MYTCTQTCTQSHIATYVATYTYVCTYIEQIHKEHQHTHISDTTTYVATYLRKTLCYVDNIAKYVTMQLKLLNMTNTFDGDFTILI